jgi:uncharacterized protein (TIGR03545 family)
MSRTVRWQNIVSRLMLVAVLLLAAQYVVGRIVRRVAAGWLEAATSKPVDLEHARVSLLRRELALNDLRIRTGVESVQPLVEVARCDLKFAVAPLLHKKVTFEQGVLRGMRFSVPPGAAARTSRRSGDSAGEIKWLDAHASDEAERWLARLDQCFEQDIPRQFASLAQTNQLWDRWPEQARQFDERIRRLKQRAAELRQSAQAALVNPLRHVEFLRKLPNEVAELRADFTRAQTDLEQLAGSFEADRRAIVHARRQDEDRLRAGVHLEPVDANVLSTYLLRRQVSSQVSELIAVLRWVREIVPADRSTTPRGTRGEDVVFAGCRPTPDFLIRNLQLHGTARLGGQTVELAGVLSDVTNSPALHSSPVRLTAKTKGAVPLDLRAVIDRTGTVARDELIVDCRGMVVPALNLGKTDGLSLALAPSVATMSISVLVEGEKLSGNIQLVGRQVKITPMLSGQLGDVPMAAALQATLANLDSLAVQVSLSGTLSEPTCSLWSNVGPAVAEAMQRAMRHAGDEHAQALVARARRRIDQRLASLEKQINAHQSELNAQSTAATAELVRVATQQTPAPRLSHERLGTRLPAGSLLR